MIRSFGYGLYMAEIVPPELSPKGKSEFRNGDRAKMTEALQDRIRKSGLPAIQEILPDPDDPEKAYVILGQGKEPCKFEIEQMHEYGDNLKFVAESNPSSRLSERIEMIESTGASPG